MDTEKNIWNRVKAPAPTSVITENAEQGKIFMAHFLAEYQQEMQQQQIAPIEIVCSKYGTAADFWHALTSGCYNIASKLIDDTGKKIIDRYYKQATIADSTDSIKSWLLRIVGDVKKNSGWTLLITLQNFDALVEYCSASDVLKIRNLADIAIIMTVSQRPLDVLCNEKYNNPYFSNQFEPFCYP